MPAGGLISAPKETVLAGNPRRVPLFLDVCCFDDRGGPGKQIYFRICAHHLLPVRRFEFPSFSCLYICFQTKQHAPKNNGMRLEFPGFGTKG